MYLWNIDLNVKLEEVGFRVCFLFFKTHFYEINTDCDVRSAACRQRIDARGNAINSRPNFASKTKKCDYEDQKFWLIPGGNSNSSCCQFFQTKMFLNSWFSSQNRPRQATIPYFGSHCISFSRSYPATSLLWYQFWGDFQYFFQNLSWNFQIEISEEMRNLPSLIGKNEFQLYELPDPFGLSSA